MSEEELIRQAFNEEAQEHFEAISLALTESSPQAVNSLFRAFHTIKGNSGMLGLNAVSKIAHAVESLMDPFRSSGVWLDTASVLIVEEGMELIQKEIKGETLGEESLTVFLDKAKIHLEEVLKKKEAGEVLESAPVSEREHSKSQEANLGRQVKLSSESLNHLKRVSREIDRSIHSLLDDENEGFSVEELKKLLHRQKSVLDEVCTVPVEAVFKKLPRIVDEASKSTGKKIKLRIESEGALIDQVAAATVSDPLIHIVRNAIDHGIEDLEKRLQAGKSEVGLIEVKSYVDFGFVNIEVRDDGGGIDPEAVRKKAVKKGIISEEVSRQFNSKQLIGLLMAPGFSTRDEASLLSGRGVGMDVVKEEITKVRGQIGIRSELGKETMVRLRIPLAYSEEEVFWVRVGKTWCALPVSERKSRILEYQNTPPSDPCVHLADLIQTQSSWENQGWIQAETRFGTVTIVVDEIGEKGKVSVKPLDHFWSQSPFMIGATEGEDKKCSPVLTWQGLGQIFAEFKRQNKLILPQNPIKKVAA